MDEQAKLDLLAAMFQDESAESLRAYLKRARGDVQLATNSILQLDGDPAPQQSKRGGLGSWLGIAPAQKRQRTLLVKGNSSAKSATTSKNAFDLLKPPSPVIAAPTTAALPALPLTTSEMIRIHTNGLCTLIPNVLPTELAARLFVRMVEESTGADKKGGWEKNRWWLFDRQVESPHTTSFYVERPANSTASAYDQESFAEAAKHWYNGEQRDSRYFTNEMEEARRLIGPLVRSVLSTRERNDLEWQGDWQPNVAAANCYRGRKESVGPHSDVLTYLGPFPTIASISLGVARSFRLRASLPPALGQPPTRTLSIHLPHNSLLIMHAGCQELFKHEIPASSAGLDLYKLPQSIGLEKLEGFGEEVLARKWNERINMTFRFYRPDFAPIPFSDALANSSLFLPRDPNYIGTPICRCGIPCSLRPDARGKVKARIASASSSSEQGGIAGEKEELIFFWTCNAGGQAQGKTCGHFQVMDFKKEGRGKYFVQ